MKALQTLFAVGLTLLLATGCAGIQPVRSIAKGEEIFLDFTCHDQGGGILFTTDPAIAGDNALKKSRVFSYPNDYASGPVTAGIERPLQIAQEGFRPLEPELYYHLSQALVGKEKERAYEIALDSEIPKGLADELRFQVRPRTIISPRIRTLPRFHYSRYFEGPPEIGKILINGKREVGRVTSFDDETVSYERFIPPGGHYDSFLGTARMEIKGDQIFTMYDAKVGTHVRKNGALGKIVEVTDKTITIDYGHPFAGETLQCRVKAFNHNPHPEEKNKIADDPGKPKEDME